MKNLHYRRVSPSWAAANEVSTHVPYRRARQRGFTVVEMLVVLAVVGMLLGIAAPQYIRHLDSARDTVLRRDLQQMREAIDLYHGDIGKYPVSLQDLVTNRYLRAIPVDPVTQKSTTWIAVPSTASGVGTDSGVFDVRSGAPGASRDGGAYASW